MPTTTELGERIKQRRLARNLTLKQVGDKAKVSATHLSEIERGKTSPTVGALKRIARALGDDPARLVAEETGLRLSVVRRRERRVWSGDASTVQVLSRPVRPHELTLLEIELAPGGRDASEGLADSGEVMIIVLEGEVEVTRAGKVHVLREGDVVHFAVRDAHEVRAAGGSAARVLRVACPSVVL
jgi:transcriptional regulator with XRE-family HTH domain